MMIVHRVFAMSIILSVGDGRRAEGGRLSSLSDHPPQVGWELRRETVMVTMDDSGAGRAEREVPPEKSKSPTLSQSELIELGRIGKKIEKHFGFNVDVEWAFHNKILYILQTRKIRNLEESAKN